MTDPAPRFRIVERGAAPRRGWLAVIALAWLLSLAATWWLASGRAAPGPGAGLAVAGRSPAELQRRIAELDQRLVTLQRSDQISRAANGELQSSLAERDEEIAGLRADVAFYERLVGATTQRKGLNVHSVEFSQEEAGTWRYRAVLTQNLNRGAISQGQLRFSIEGVRAGKLASIGWNELHQSKETPGQDYSFRYFQELGGSVMLPRDFTPQHVRVSLRGNGGNVEQTFDWKPASGGEGT